MKKGLKKLLKNTCNKREYVRRINETKTTVLLRIVCNKHLLNLIVEHVDKKVQGQHGQVVVFHRQACQRVHRGNAHGKALVLQPVDKGSAASCSVQILNREIKHH